MQFLAIVRYKHGTTMTHEFRSPLERAVFLKALREQKSAARIQIKDRVEREDDGSHQEAPAGESDWYEAPQPKEETQMRHISHYESADHLEVRPTHEGDAVMITGSDGCDTTRTFIIEVERADLPDFLLQLEAASDAIQERSV